MKKPISLIKSFFILTFSLFFVASCGQTNTPTLNINGYLADTSNDYQYASLDDFVIRLDNNMLITLIESQESFVLYYGNAYCGSCLDFQPSLIEYVSKQKTLIYYYDSYLHHSMYPALISAYPDFFKENALTPSLYFFKDGSLTTRQDGNNRMMVYRTFLPMMEGYAKVGTIKSIHTVAGFTNYLETAQGLSFIYDRNDGQLTSFYRDQLKPFLATNNQSLTIIEKSLDADLATYLATLDPPFNLDNGFTLFSNGQIISYQTFTNNGQQIINWLTDSL